MSAEQLGLEEQRDLLLRSLRDLERERAAGEINDDDYTTLKDDYTARAAAVLRAIESGRTGRPRPGRSGARPSTGAPGRATRPGPRGSGSRPTGGAPGRATRPGPRGSGSRALGTRGAAPVADGAAPTARPRRGAAPAGPDGTVPNARRGRSVAVTIGVVFAVIAVAGVSVVLLAGDRDPGAPVTGSVPTTVADTTSGRVAEALQLETEGKAVDALKIYDELIAEDPDHVEALAYRGWLLKRAGMPDEALASLDRAVAADPTFPDAHFFRGMVLYQDKDDPAGAVIEFQAFLDNNPLPQFVSAVEEVRAQAEQAAAAKAAGTPPPTQPAPPAG